MLVVSRKKSEQILVGDEITITVVRISPYAVRLGIDAPNGMKIVRGELLRYTDVVTDEPVGDGSPATEGNK